MGAVCSPKELLEIGGVLRCARTVKSYVAEDEKPTVLNPLFGALTPTNIWRTAFSGPFSRRKKLRTPPVPLADIRRHMRIQAGRSGTACKKSFLPRHIQIPAGAIITIRQGRYVVPVKSECKNDVPGLVRRVRHRDPPILWSQCPPSMLTMPCGDLELKKKEIERILAELPAGRWLPGSH